MDPGWLFYWTSLSCSESSERRLQENGTHYLFPSLAWRLDFTDMSNAVMATFYLLIAHFKYLWAYSSSLFIMFWKIFLWLPGPWKWPRQHISLISHLFGSWLFQNFPQSPYHLYLMFWYPKYGRFASEGWFQVLWEENYNEQISVWPVKETASEYTQPQEPDIFTILPQPMLMDRRGCYKEIIPAETIWPNLLTKAGELCQSLKWAHIFPPGHFQKQRLNSRQQYSLCKDLIYFHKTGTVVTFLESHSDTV